MTRSESPLRDQGLHGIGAMCWLMLNTSTGSLHAWEARDFLVCEAILIQLFHHVKFNDTKVS